MPNPVSFRYFKTSPEIIQLAVMLYVRFPLSLRNVEDLLHERGVDVSYESVRYWWHRSLSPLKLCHNLLETEDRTYGSEALFGRRYFEAVTRD